MVTVFKNFNCMLDTSIWALIEYLYLYLIFELEAMYSKKKPMKMHCNTSKCIYVAEVSAKIANDIPKNVKKQIILFHSKVWSNL